MTERASDRANQQQADHRIEPGRMDYAFEILRGEQRFPLGFLAGLAAALVGAGVWAVVTVATGYQIGWMAVGVGVLVGFAVRIGGKGIDKLYGFTGAALSLIGCLIGNLFAVCAMVASAESVPLSEILGRLNPQVTAQFLSVTFNPIDLLFYALAIYEGYRFSFRRLTDEDLARVLPELRTRIAA